MTDATSLKESLPEQLPIIENDSTHSAELHKVIPPRATKKQKSKKLQIVLKAKHSILSRNFTSGLQLNNENISVLKKEISPFGYPKDIEEFAYKVLNHSWRKDIRIKELQNKVFNKLSFKDRQKKDLLNRLYVKPSHLVEGKSVLSIDPNYYKSVEATSNLDIPSERALNLLQGRPIPDKLEIRKYVQIVRESLRTKIIAGYREDDIILIEETMKLEQKIIDIIKQNLETYINIFEEFLIIDHRSAMQLLQESENLAADAYEKYMEHKIVANKYAFLRSSIYIVEDKWKLCKMYVRFLYNLSPLTWRMEQEQENVKDRRTSLYMMERQPEDQMPDLFGKNQTSLSENVISLEDLINEFRNEISDDRHPSLYFTESNQLLQALMFIEMQNLNSLLHSEELAAPLANIMEGMVNAVCLFDKEIKKLVEIIEKLEGGISWEEQRVIFLEKLALNLIKTEFKNLLMDENIVNLQVLVEDLYEAKIGPNDTNLNIGDMMKAIEEIYRYELLLLDKVPSYQIELLEGNCYQEETNLMKLAERAAKQFADLERITINMKKTYAPPPKKINKELKWRSPPKKDPTAVQEPPRCLTEKEVDFLEFFTNYCKYTDNPEDFGINFLKVAAKMDEYEFRKNIIKEEKKI